MLRRLSSSFIHSRTQNDMNKWAKMTWSDICVSTRCFPARTSSAQSGMFISLFRLYDSFLFMGSVLPYSVFLCTRTKQKTGWCCFFYDVHHIIYIYVHHSIRFFWRHQDMNRFAASLSSKSNALVELLLERSDRFAMNFRPASGLWVRRRYMAFTPVNTSLLRLKFETRTSLLSSSFECAREDCPSVSMNEL